MNDQPEDGSQHDRQRFLETHFMFARKAAVDANGMSDRIVVLADLADHSGSLFAETFAELAGCSFVDGTAWAAHFNRDVLVAIFGEAWPEISNVVSAIGSDDLREHDLWLVISHGGVQLRGARRPEEVPQ